MFYILLLLIIIILVFTVRGGAEVDKNPLQKPLKKIWKILWNITEKNRKNKDYKHLYLSAYYNGQDVAGTIKISKYYSEIITPREKPLNIPPIIRMPPEKIKIINNKYLSWPTSGWNISGDTVEELYKYFIFDAPVGPDILNHPHLPIVDVFGTLYSRVFWYHCGPRDEAEFGSTEDLSGRALHLMVPNMEGLVKKAVELLKLHPGRAFVCIKSAWADRFAGYEKKIDIKRLYSHRCKRYKTVNNYVGLFFNLKN